MRGQRDIYTPSFNEFKCIETMHVSFFLCFCYRCFNVFSQLVKKHHKYRTTEKAPLMCVLMAQTFK